MNAKEFLKENYTLTNGGEDLFCNHSGQLVGAEDIAEAYHEHKLKLLGIANVVGQSEQPSNQWISVKDELPNDIGSYLCFWEDCYVGMLFFNSNKEWYEMWEQEKHTPTHWMPLPKPPKK